MNGALKFRPGSDDDADGFAEPHHQDLLGLLHGEDRAVADDDDDKQRDQGNDACNGRPHRVPPPCCGWPVVAGAGGRFGVNSLSGRYGTMLCEPPPS